MRNLRIILWAVFLLAALFVAAAVLYMGSVLSVAEDELRFCKAQFSRQGVLGKVVQADGRRAVIEARFGWVVIEGRAAEKFTEGECAWFGTRAFPSRCE